MMSVVLGSLFVAAIAAADNKTADEWFKEGETEYDLGNFDKAADAFKQAFSLETNEAKRPAYLYNVAQAYRQGGKCKDAAFFYKRFLALRDTDAAHPLKPEVHQATEKLVSEMEDCAKQQEASAGKPPTTTMNPTDGNTTTGNTTTGNTTGNTTNTAKPKTVGQEGEEGGEEGGEGGEVHAQPGEVPKLMSARLLGGAAKVNAGDLSVPVEGSFAVIGGYPVPLNAQSRVELGLAITETPVGYKNFITGESATATFTTVLANAGLTYSLAPKISARADLGVGVLVLGGIDQMGNPFTENGSPTTGSLVMGALRAGVSIDYDITPNISATAMPFAFTYSPAKSGLRDNMSAITRMDFMVGVGYRM
jgi:tetratricopeptide (TPR) repeat protein